MRLKAIRLILANVLFFAGAVAIVAGAWLATEWHLMATGFIAGLVMFALADLIAPS